jgi:phosphatidylethanolamine/phosphatidyl-N-methylethanolamine N-methyltransferase
MSNDLPASLLFWRSLLNDPRKMGALVPSSSQLSRLIASRVDPSQSSVLEVGAGTGAITRALLRRGLRPERLFIIERDPVLSGFLRTNFPRVRICCGEAAHAPNILSGAGVGPVDTIVSSLPLRNLRQADQLEIFRAMMSTLNGKGQIIQFTYGPTCPIPSRRLGLEAECIGRVWMNFPPATVWRFTKRPHSIGRIVHHKA